MSCICLGHIDNHSKIKIIHTIPPPNPRGQHHGQGLITRIHNRRDCWIACRNAHGSLRNQQCQRHFHSIAKRHPRNSDRSRNLGLPHLPPRDKPKFVAALAHLVRHQLTYNPPTLKAGLTILPKTPILALELTKNNENP